MAVFIPLDLHIGKAAGITKANIAMVTIQIVHVVITEVDTGMARMGTIAKAKVTNYVCKKGIDSIFCVVRKKKG